MLYEILYCAMVAEQKKYREWLLSLPPQVILRYAREYSIREKILSVVSDKELPNVHAKVLMQSFTPLADIARYVLMVQTNEEDIIMDCIDILTDDMLRESGDK